MASICKVIIIGHLGRDPENRSGVVNISVATTENWTDRNGQKQEHTEWHRVTFFGKLAEIANQYLRKGSQVYIEGRLRTDEYTDKEGIKRYQTGIIADRMQMLDRKQDSGNSSNSNGRNSYAEAKQTGRRAAPPAHDDSDDVPF